MASNLPPGCTNADIDKAAGAYPLQCKECGCTVMAYDLDENGLCEECAKLSPCCGVEFDEDIRICPQCGEHV